jgi:hypothetical protein
LHNKERKWSGFTTLYSWLRLSTGNEHKLSGGSFDLIQESEKQWDNEGISSLSLSPRGSVSPVRGPVHRYFIYGFYDL